MILGLSTPTFTLVHVVLSLVGIFAGLVVLGGMLRSRRLEGWTAIFLWTTVLTSVTGFLFPFKEVLPSHVVGIVSLLALAPALVGLYVYRLAGRWRAIYVVTAVFALYLNCFVGVVQAFLKVPFLHALAPQQTELPFVLAQLAVLVILATLGFRAVRAFHPAPAATGLRAA
jgi:hypothetical protein